MRPSTHEPMADMTSIEQIDDDVRCFPLADRLPLVERVVHQGIGASGPRKRNRGRGLAATRLCPGSWSAIRPSTATALLCGCRTHYLAKRLRAAGGEWPNAASGRHDLGE
jgi:hypothetical protein